MNHLKTGGGKPDFIPPDEVLDRVASLLGSTCTGYEVPFGGDGFSDGSVVVELEVDNFAGGSTSQEQNDADNINKTEIVLCPSVIDKGKKRKVDFDCQDNQKDDVGAKFLFGMPTMSKALQTKDKKREKQTNWRQERDRAIANYYIKKTEKLELEIKLLNKDLENKENNSNN